MTISAILLAAGSGSRFGGGKLLAKLPDGTPIGIASWRNLARAVSRCVVVVRAGDSVLHDMLTSEGAQVVECGDADLGMSRSLIAGILAAGEVDGWVIALGDMPYIKPETITKVAGAIGAEALVVLPTYHGKRGHPVAISARLRDELLEVRGDEGARAVIKRHTDDSLLIPCDDDPGILRDIDTRADID